MPKSLNRLIYMDDSGDPRTGLAVFGWIEVSPDDWSSVLGSWLAHRKRMDHGYAVPVSKELHMTEFVLGRGRISRRIPERFISPKGKELWKEFGEFVAIEGLETLKSTGGLRVGSVYRQGPPNELHVTKTQLYSDWLQVFEAELAENDEMAIIFMDGNGTDGLRRAHRDLSRKTRHIIEDPIYLDSRSSQLIQIADHVAWCANSYLMQVPKHEFAHGWYEQYLSSRDQYRRPREI